MCHLYPYNNVKLLRDGNSRLKVNYLLVIKHNESIESIESIETHTSCRQFHRFVAVRRMSSKLPSQKTADTSKDELLLSGGIRHLTATSQYQAYRKQVPTYVSNIVYMRYFLAIFRLLARKNI